MDERMDRQIDGRIGGRINRGTERHTEKSSKDGVDGQTESWSSWNLGFDKLSTE
jgi:hypothetical protein